MNISGRGLGGGCDSTELDLCEKQNILSAREARLCRLDWYRLRFERGLLCEWTMQIASIGRRRRKNE